MSLTLDYIILLSKAFFNQHQRRRPPVVHRPPEPGILDECHVRQNPERVDHRGQGWGGSRQHGRPQGRGVQKAQGEESPYESTSGNRGWLAVNSL